MQVTKRKRKYTSSKHPLAADGFSERERTLLTLLARGFHLPDIADRLGVSRHTLADNLRSIFDKTAASTQAEAVYRAVKEGVIT